MTMDCPTCKAVVPDDSQYCSACGASTRDGVSTIAEFLDRRADALLAEANLLRMRAQWHDAEGRCIEVMRANPNNVHAHSLLGDIYRDQGKYEEAAQWYQLALDLNPDSIADRSKLDHVEQVWARQIVNRPAASSGTQRLIGLPPAIWVRALTVLSVVFLVLVVGIAIAMRNSRKTVDASSGTLSGAVIQPAAPGSPLPLPTSSPPATQAQTEPVQAPKTVVPPAAPRSASSGFTSEELALRNHLSKPDILGPDTSVASATLDPRDERAELVVTYTGRASNVESLRLALLHSAYRAALAAFDAHAGAQGVTVNLRVLNAGRIERAFSGDVERAVAQTIPLNAAPDQILAAFANAWWAPGIAPQQPRPAQPASPGTE